eukprot:gene11808-13032_t
MQTEQSSVSEELKMKQFPLDKLHHARRVGQDELTLHAKLALKKYTKTSKTEAQKSREKKRGSNEFTGKIMTTTSLKESAKTRNNTRRTSPKDVESLRSQGREGAAKQQKVSPNEIDKRRVANARERTRVHTLSSAFNALKHAIPRYSVNQRLSKLTILKVAISYIAALDALNRSMGSNSDNSIGFQQNVDRCSKALQSEYGKAKKKA